MADANLGRASLIAITGQAGREQIHKEYYPGPAKEGRDEVNAVHDFMATLISDPVMRERVLYVFSALPEGVQAEFMGDPGFGMGIYDTGPRGGSRLLIPCPQAAQGSRLVALERSLTARSRAFAHYVIAHELAHALLRNRGRHPEEDPEVAADSLAAAWGFPRPATLPLLGADPRKSRRF
ncbi:MAG: hypothetical protein Q8P98_10315 [Candidatus Rokubacteria bacterium]|nr:hypothetical protein [Candidatus Rokubacteria bacterium]